MSTGRRSPSSSPSHSPVRRRSVEMLTEMDFKFFNQKTEQGETYLEIAGTDYRVLDSTVTEFNNDDKPIASVGKALGREIIILDPNSKYLKEVYKGLKTEIERFEEQIKRKNKEKMTAQLEKQISEAMLQLTMDHVKKCLEGRVPAVKEIRESSTNWMAEYKELPVISLDTFIQKGAGVCRHHGLFNAYLLNRLIIDKLLPPGNVYVNRDVLKNGNAHVWAIYKPIQLKASHYNVYLIDSLKFKEDYNLSAEDSRIYLEDCYGKGPVDRCVKRYDRSDLEIVAYTSITDRKIKEDFIDCILDASENDCRKFLNHQHRLKACAAIEDALLDYKNHKNYAPVLADVRRVLRTNDFHERYYFDKITNADDAQQFVLGLLCKSEEERSLVLEDQDLKALEEIKKSLTKDELFLQFDEYQSLVKDIDNRIHTKLLHEKSYDKIEEADDRQQFMLGLLLCSSDERAVILDRQDLSDLEHMKRSLKITSSKREDNIYRHIDTFSTVTGEIDKHIRAKKTELEYLHEKPYDQIEKKEDRQKFMVGLLHQSSEENAAVFAKQDVDDLEHMKQSLTRPIYDDYASKQTVENEIDKSIALKSIDLIKTIILSGKLEIRSDAPTWTVTFWAPGSKIQTISGDVAVPDCCKEFYDKIQQVNFKTASLKQLTKLISDIKKRASDSIEGYTNQNTKTFLMILKDHANDPIELFKNLKRFQDKFLAPHPQSSSRKR